MSRTNEEKSISPLDIVSHDIAYFCFLDAAQASVSRADDELY